MQKKSSQHKAWEVCISNALFLCELWIQSHCNCCTTRNETSKETWEETEGPQHLIKHLEYWNSNTLQWSMQQNVCEMSLGLFTTNFIRSGRKPFLDSFLVVLRSSDRLINHKHQHINQTHTCPDQRYQHLSPIVFYIINKQTRVLWT